MTILDSTQPTTNNTQKGREALQDWEASKRHNAFEADTNLQSVLKFYLGARYESFAPRFQALGEHVYTTLDMLAREEDRLGNHPRLERWSSIGERLESIVFHPNHHAAGRIIWETGVMALQADPGHTVAQMGLYYLLGQNGEAGHLCSLACTSGLIRSLQEAADPALREMYLPPLLDSNFETMQHGAQFLTEVQGGSDVGANAVTAVQQSDGAWRITGEKWFCSNINADQFLMTARVHSEGGTRGLGLFLVPRRLTDGTLNGFFMRRLKDKLGTRTLASAELDFKEAVGYAVGPVEKGFKNAVELVLNTSRLMNAVACAGLMQRASMEARTYAMHRTAFGKPLIEYPMVQEALADLRAETYAATAASFALANLVDKIDMEQANVQEKVAYRLLVNMNKYSTSISAQQMIHRAIEVLGGNGAIETFSILPRLYRDIVVLESWEGPHNVLCLQILRDALRQDLAAPYAAWLREFTACLKYEEIATLVDALERDIVGWERQFSVLQSADEMTQNAYARRWVDQMAWITGAALLLGEAQQEITQQGRLDKIDVLRHYWNRHNPTYDAFADDDYVARLGRLAKG